MATKIKDTAVSKSTARRKPTTEERRSHLIHAVHHTAHMLSEQGPMNITFVHNNTLLGLQGQHFHDAIETARATLGLEGYQPDSHFLGAFATGRITDGDLDDSIAMQPGLDGAAEVARLGERAVTRGEVIKAALRGSAVQRRTVTAIARDFDPELGLLGLGEEEARLRSVLTAAGRPAIDAALEAVGAGQTLGEWLGGHFGVDAVSMVAEACGHGHLPPGAADAKRALDAMGIPSDLRDAYRARATHLWGEAAEAALAVEARLVARLAEERLGCPGRLTDIVATFRSAPDGYALRALHSTVVRALAGDGTIGLDRAPVTDPGTQARPLAAVDFALLAGLVKASGDDLNRDLATARKTVVRVLRCGLLCDTDLPALRALAEGTPDTDLRSAVRMLAATTAAEAFDAAVASAASWVAEGLVSGQGIADIVQALTGIDLTAKVNAAMIRHLSAFTDEGLASLRMPDRHLGLFTAWRRAAQSDSLLLFEGGAGWQAALAALPADPAEALIAMLDRIGVPDDQWEHFLARSLVQLRGWAGMMFWMEIHPGHHKQKQHPTDTIQYLAIRLFTETAVADAILQEVCGIPARAVDLRNWAVRNAPEVLLRRALHAGELAPDLTEQASILLSMRPPSAADRADLARLAHRHWLGGSLAATKSAAAADADRVMRVAAGLGLVAADFTAAPATARAILAELDSLTPRAVSRLWLEAYEGHYRDEVLNALSQNKGRGRWINGRDRRPRAQLVLCIDEREENIHRYFGELDPDYETFGAAGFFGVAIAHSGLGDHGVTPLCPAVATPGHRTAEVPRDAVLGTVWPVAQRRTAFADAFGAVMWETKRNPVVAFATTQLTGLFHAIPLVGRIFSPLRYHRAATSAMARIHPTVPTRLTHTRIEGADLARFGLHAEDRPYGFDPTEGADRIEAQLRNWGLVRNFARIVVTCSHRSFSVNNPHENAHDCGACSGKPGGVNARLFAALANDPAVRNELCARGIDIPDDTWFVGAEHNTCTDDFLCFDLEDIPSFLREDWDQVARDLDETSARAARERCRRFRGAPKDATPDQSWDHVKGRSQDLSQVRPEWGHATNAFAVVGRRALTQGLFFDRRGFVISYDPTQDADGRILERILMAVGPVGAGINLEYYFSTVNPDGYGSGTKVPHNVVGMIGVMPGAQGDLATGLPRQMTEVHEAMRLQLIVDAPLSIAGEIYGRQPAIQELLNGQWVHLIVHDPETCTFHRFVPGVGFVEWSKPLTPLPEVDDSYQWIRGKHDCFLPPARINEPITRWDAPLADRRI